VEIRLLGPIEVRDGERTVALPRRQQRALLAALALRAGEVVSTDRLVADLWGDRAPASATGSLQNTVSALRKALGREVVLTQPPGYRLALEPDRVDAHRFEKLLAAGRGAEESARPRLLGDALALWRGPALADLDEEQFARLEGARLDELRVAAQEERIESELVLGRHGSVVGELETLVSAHPLRERLRGQLMLALYRCGRQAEALEVYRAARLALADELGLDPSPELQELERKVLRQDPELAAPAEVADDAPDREVSERRLVTVLAAMPPAADDPEQHRRRLDETLASVRDVLGRHGGVLERFGPEGLVAVFGADGPEDDDAVRAVLAARELDLPTGVATGEVVQGAGAVVTRAVELARAGGIGLDERTRAIVGAERRLDAPLVGRDQELARLRAILTAVREAGRCRVVTVVGEPGIGKTRLARELALGEAGRATVLVARCVAHGDGVTFLPLLGALGRAEPEHALAGEPDGDLVLARLGALAEGTQAAPLGESYWAVRRLLEALAQKQPALLVLDDVHWAEPALVDLVDYLADRVDGPLLVLCLARPELERPLGESLALGPLGEDEARAIVAGTAEVDESTRDRIIALAEGNALYVEQLASFAAEGGEGLPPTLEAVLAGRLGRLGPNERAVLQRAAVVGREFSLGAVAALTGGEVARDLLALSRAGFVHPTRGADPGDDGYSFHHVLLRDAAYASLTKADRADLHELAAAWLDRDGPGDDSLVGYHLEQAVHWRRQLGEDENDLASTAGKRLGDAGMRAWRGNDVSAATRLLGRAIALLPSGKDRAELLWERSLALRLEGNPLDADAALAEADRVAHAAGARDIEARVSAERARARLYKGEISLDEAVAVFTQAIVTLSAAEDERGLGRAKLCLSSVHWLACNLGELGAAATQAAQHYVAAGFSPAACLGNQGEALFYGPIPVPAASLQCAAMLEVAPDRMSEATLTAVLGGLRAYAGLYDDAHALLERARELFGDVGSERGLETVWVPLRMAAHLAAGNREDAANLGRRSLETLLAGRDAAYASTRAAQLADILLDLGDEEDAARKLEIVRETVLPSDVLVQFLLRSAAARLAARTGDHDEALALGRAAVEISSLTDAVVDRARSHLALAEVFVRGGQEAEGQSQAAEARRLLTSKGAVALLLQSTGVPAA
jgi:DNA-binding SARP family transcriptional activator